MRYLCIKYQKVRMGRQTSVEIRKRVIELYKEGKSQRDIAEFVNKSRGTVQHIIHRFIREGRIENKVKSSCRKAFSERNEAFIIREIKKNPRLSAPKLTEMVRSQLDIQVHPETVRRVLRKYGYNGRMARKKPFISKINRQKRLEFARKYIQKDMNFWQRVLFTDESKFNLFGSDGKQMVWRKKNSELQLKNLTPSVKHGGGSVMVWGCMAGSGTGNLQHISGIMNKFVYLNILKQNVKPSVEKLGIEDDFYFYQDNDPKHKSYIAREWLLYNCPHVLEVPPQSPDLNIIENLWAYLDRNIRKHAITSQKDLLDALQSEWTAITSSYTQNLLESMPRRLQAVISAKGGPTKY